MKISVIIPTMNEDEMLRDMLKQFKGEEVIVVADSRGSSDSTLNLAREMGARAVTTDKDLSGARNLGASMATGDWLLHTDSDLRYWSDTPCKDLEKWVGEHPGVLAAAGPAEQEIKTPLSHVRETIRNWVPIFFGHYHLIRKDIFDSMGGYHSRHECFMGWEDFDMMERLLLRGIHVYQTPFATVHRRQFNFRGFDGRVWFRF